VVVPRARERSSSGESEREWLGSGALPRSRPWALEEELLGAGSSIARARLLERLEADLVEEESELARAAEQLQRQAARLAELRARLAAATRPARERPPAAESPGDAGGERATRRVAGGLDYRLCRCEGFEVETPTRRVGVVDGLRYHSRIDRPDALEVRAGPFGRQLLLIPVEEVDRVLFEEGRLILRSAPRMRHEHLLELLSRLRGRPRDGAPQGDRG
jgi:uncharacterized coiled-coil protein SlyX